MIRLKPSKIVAIYALTSAIWILFSDSVVGFLFSDSVKTITLISTFKGWLYICIISTLLYILLKFYEKENTRQLDKLQESDDRFQAIFNSVSDCIFIHDAKTGRIIDVNARTCATFGYRREELITLDVGSISTGIPPYTQYEAEKKIHQALEGNIISFEWNCKAHDGHTFWVQIFASSAIINGTERVLVSLQDITERKQTEITLSEEKKFINAVFDSLPGLLYLYNDQGQLIRWNKQHETITGYTSKELLHMNILDWYKGDQLTQQNITKAINRIIQDGIATEEADLQTKSGEKIPFYFKAVRLEIEGKLYFVGVGIDITERRQLEKQLTFRALHDPLTGLANRTLCLDRIAQAHERAARNPNYTFSVVFIDLDRFKVINDSLGHDAGDLALREVATRLLSCVRRVDTVCRYGGDEFILVLEDISKRDTMRTLQRVRAALKPSLTIDSHVLHVGASFGIAYAPQANSQADDCLRNANIALHFAKMLGKGKAAIYRKGMHDAALHTMSLQNDMRRGLEAQEFFLVYQPIFNLKNNYLKGFEALIRWNHPQRGLVSPAEFIPMAEESGLIYEIGKFVLNKACTDMASLLPNINKDECLTISVNISAKQLSRHGLAEQIEQALLASNLQAHSLILEVTESSIMEHPESSAQILAKLKSKGVGIALDDFGTGYSSMNSLQTLPLNRLKIDISFVRRITESKEDQEIVRAIIMLAHSLHLQTVAEGIETLPQLEILKQLGCEMGQGYLCSRPMLLTDVPYAINNKVCPSTTS